MTTTTEERKVRQLLETGDLGWLRTSIVQQIGVYIDAGRLEAGEALELIGLQRTLTKREGWEAPGFKKFAFSRLTEKEQDRWRSLVGKAAGEPGLLDWIAEDEGLRKKFSELARRTRPQERPLIEEPGSVRLSKELVFDWLLTGDPILEWRHLGMLVFVLGCLENGRSSVLGGRVEGEGAERVLVLPRGSAIDKFDPPGVIDVSKTLQHLAANALLTFDETRSERRIGYGPRTRPAAEPAS